MYIDVKEPTKSMRTVESALQFLVSKEFELPGGGLPVEIRRNNDLSTQIFSIYEVSGNPAAILTGQINLDPDSHLLLFNWGKTILTRTAKNPYPQIVSPLSAYYLRSGKTSIRFNRGQHHATIITWNKDATPALETWVQGVLKAKQYTRTAAARSFSLGLNECSRRFKRAIESASDSLDLNLLSIVHQAVCHLLENEDRVSFFAHPVGLPENITAIIEKVTRNPANHWPITEAAKIAGYSSYHFSRIFKANLGYGFQEFVDRKRTALATNLLRATSESVDDVAIRAGFTNTQGMRDSMRDLLGCVPSEIRSVPEP